MDFNFLSRRKLQALCKYNKLPANLTNLAMADSLNSLQYVEGIEEILNQSEFEIAQSPMVPPTGGRSRTVKAVGVLETPAAAPTTASKRRAADASAPASVRRKIEVSPMESLDEIEEVKKDVCVETPALAPASQRRRVIETSTVKHAYSTRRSARLAEKIEEPKEISEAIKIKSFGEVIDENGVQCENLEISALRKCEGREVKPDDESKEISEGTSEIPNGDVAVASIGQKVSSDIKTDSDRKENEPVRGLVSEEVCVMATEGSIEDTKLYPYVAQATNEVKAYIEDTEMDSNMDEETEASIEKVTAIDSNVIEALVDGELKSNVDEVTKAVSVLEHTDDEEIDIAEIKVRTKIELSSKEPLDDIGEVKKDVSVKTPAPASRRRVRETSTVKHAYNTRRSARLADKIEEPKEISEAIEISSFTEAIDQNEPVHGLVSEEVCVMETEGSIEDTKMNSNKNEEVEASIEDAEMNSKTEGPIEKVAVIESNVNEADSEDGDIKSNVDEATKVVSIEDVCVMATEGSIEDAEMKSNMDEETETSIEKVAVINSNVNEASSEDGEIKSKVDEGTNVLSIEEVCVLATEGSIEDTKMYPCVAQETKASIEDAEMKSNMDEETVASIEKVALIDFNVNEASSEDGEMKSNVDKTPKVVSIEDVCVMETKASIDAEMNSNMDEETVAPIEKVAVIESNVNEASSEDGEMKSNVDRATKVVSIEDVCVMATEGSFEDAEMKSNMDEETETSIEKVAVIDSNVNEASSEEGEMKSNVDEATKVVSIEDVCVMATESSIEDAEKNYNMDEETEPPIEKVAVIESNVNEASSEDGEMKSSVDETTKVRSTEDVFVMATKSSIEDAEMKYNVEETTKVVSTEDVCVMATKASIEDAEMKSNMDEETEASIEKVAVIYSNVNGASSEDGEMNTNVNEATNLVSIEEDTAINTKDDEEIDIAEIKVADVADSCNVVNEQEAAYADEIKIDGDMVDYFTVNIQETNDTELPSENRTLDEKESDMSEADFQKEKTMSIAEIQDNHGKYEIVDGDNVSATEFNREGMNLSEDILVPEVEVQDELLNAESKHEFDQEEMNVLEDASKTPKTVGRLTQISEPLEKLSIRQLNKLVKEKFIHIAAPVIKTPETVGRLTQISDDKENLDSKQKSVSQPSEKLSIRKLRKLLKENSIHIASPLINDDLASSETPKTVETSIRISDDKENLDSGRKSVLVEEPFEKLSIRQLSKLVKEKSVQLQS